MYLYLYFICICIRPNIDKNWELFKDLFLAQKNIFHSYNVDFVFVFACFFVCVFLDEIIPAIFVETFLLRLLENDQTGETAMPTCVRYPPYGP